VEAAADCPEGAPGLLSAQRAAALIFLAFLLPLSLYLLLLGAFNRRPTPVLVSGTWDFIALLGAGCGFLLFTGPVLITSLSQHWRHFWLYGTPPSDGMELTWYFLAGGYFAFVVGGSAFRFWHVRGQSAIYNAEPDQVESALETTCERLGLPLIRSGRVYVLRNSPRAEPVAQKTTSAIQTEGGHKEVTTAVPDTRAPAGDETSLEVDAFAAMRHVTLTWKPPVSALRQDFEGELERVLADSPTPPSDLGGTLFLLGILLLTLTLVGSVALVIVRLVSPG
jgi:hypothetical protein